MQAEDIEGVELCGTLKNIVAIAAGFLAAVFCLITSIGSFLTFNWLILRNYLAGLVDGLDMGNNTKVEKLLFNTFKKIKKKHGFRGITVLWPISFFLFLRLQL
jgi:glycerol-3-phosphate dehydrogenase